MKNTRMSATPGFTLIELLVVVAIVGILASVVLASLNSARAKARDARRLSDFKSVQTAMALYFDSHRQYPQVAFSCCTEVNHNAHFEAMAQVLVNEGLLRAVPRDPAHGPGSYYMYYQYSNPIGAILVTRLETVANTTVGPYGSCRPFGNNWCSNTIASNYYCICNQR